MVQVTFAPGNYTPTPSVSFAHPLVSVCAATGYGRVKFAGGSVASIINPVVAARYHVDFAPANYTPIASVHFGGVGELTAIAHGQVQFAGRGLCQSFSVNVAFAGGSVAFAGHAACNSIVNIGAGRGVIRFLGNAVGVYDINNPHYLTATLNVNQQPGDSVSLTLHADQQATQPMTQRVSITTDTPQAVSIELNSQHNQTVLTANTTAVISEQARPLSNSIASTINQTRFISLCVCASEQNAQQLSQTLQSVQDALLFIGNRTGSQVQDCTNHHYSVTLSHYLTLIEYTPLAVAHFSPSSYTPLPIANFNNSLKADYLVEMKRGVLTVQVNTPDGKTQRLIKKTCVTVETGKQPEPGKSIKHTGTRPPPTPQPPNHITYSIPIRETYAMQHSIIVKTVADNQALELTKLSLSYDAESYAWQFNGTLANKADLSRFNLTNFEPVQLSISIDGHIWLVVVEELPESKSFGKTEIQLTGRSLSALLGEPWSQMTNFLQGSDMTVQQLADSMIPFDWTIDWQCPTWLLPANTYSHTQQTPIQSLKTIANNIGAVLYPVPDSKTLRVQPRYPVLPWNYNLAGINPDVVIPDDAVLSMGIKSRVASAINGVYVHGTTGDGILGRCVLSGTAGDVLAATESNSLITDVVAARALGERVLSGKYTQPTISTLTTFLGGDFPLLAVGNLVLANGEKATVTAVSIDVEFGTVRQHLTFGENMSNVYARFLSVLPKTPLLVGTVVSNYGDNSILSLIGGGVITARGTGSVGQHYYVRNGVIETQAPNLVEFEIVV